MESMSWTKGYLNTKYELKEFGETKNAWDLKSREVKTAEPLQFCKKNGRAAYYNVSK